MSKRRKLLSDDPWANEIEETQQNNLAQKIKFWGKNALLVTVAGSIIVVLGQWTGTVIPIMYGAEDASNFAISIEPNSVVFSIPMMDIPDDKRRNYVYEKAFSETATISVEDFHKTLRPYKFKVFLRALNVPKNITIIISPKEVKAGDSAKMTITYYHNYSSYEERATIKDLDGYNEPSEEEIEDMLVDGKDISSMDPYILLQNSLLSDYEETGNKSALDELNRLNSLPNEFNEFSEYPIDIEGVGGDGRRRNTTFFVSTKFGDKIIMLGDKGIEGTITLGSNTQEKVHVEPYED